MVVAISHVKKKAKWLCLSKERICIFIIQQIDTLTKYGQKSLDVRRST